MSEVPSQSEVSTDIPTNPQASAQPAPAAAPAPTALELRTNDGAILNYDYGENAGVGSNALPTSGFIPFLSIVSSQANCLKETNKAYLPAAKAGMFLLSGSNTLLDGKKGLFFIPLHDRHIIVEKTKMDGTGDIVGEYAGDPKGPVATELRQRCGVKKSEWKSVKGNFMVERHNVTGILYQTFEDIAAGKPLGAAVVGFERSKMRAYGRMADGFNKYPPAQRPPIFALQMHLTTFMDNADGHDFYNIKVTFPVQDDFARSLIDPKVPWFKEFAAKAREIIGAIGTGALKEHDSKEEAKAAGSDGGTGDDIPF